MDNEAHKEYSLVSTALEEINFYSSDTAVLERVSLEIWTELHERNLRLAREENRGSHNPGVD